MRFSERMGLKPVREALQIGTMDRQLRVRLWNAFEAFLDEHCRDSPQRYLARHYALRPIWDELLHWPVHERPANFVSVRDEFANWFFAAKWHEVYDLLEFVVRHAQAHLHADLQGGWNAALAGEGSGYRFVGGMLVPIANDTELGAVEEALGASQDPGLAGVQEHVVRALTLMSDREEPDYRNSIKESISAVEGMARMISGEAKATLGQALKAVEEKVGLHAALKNGFSAIYGYTSDEGGIRHALMDEEKCDFDDAKYMVVACSAFVNYLIGKAAKAGLELKPPS
jgi:hypothetical protein